MVSKVFFGLSCFGLASFVNGLSLKASSDQVTDLPEAPDVDFDQYAGYITIDNTTDKSLFYWFQTSSFGAADSPIVLWTNGGPGCSGLAGALIEQGGFRILDSKLIVNEGRWNQIANMLFIEQPIGVGFSYSESSTDYNVGDNQAAADMYAMIRQFLKEFDDYQNNDFYIASESYGGHYMPVLANYIVEHNTDNFINFKGFLVGNPLTDMVENAKGMYDTWYGHQLISYPLFMTYYKECDDGNNQNDTCQSLMNQMADQVADIYPYGLDWPNCEDSSSVYSFRMQQWFMKQVIEKHFNRKMPFLEFEHKKDQKHPFLKAKFIDNDDNNNDELGDDTSDSDSDDRNEWNACQVDFMTEYLNREDVMTALHAKLEGAATSWSLCSNITNYNYSNVYNKMEPYYQKLIDGGYGLHITIYSGDDDSVCGTLGTQSWIYDLGYDISSSWTSWTYNDQVAGYYTQFADSNGDKALTFVTVHSAGHQTPWYKPARSFEMFSKYMNGDF